MQTTQPIPSAAHTSNGSLSLPHRRRLPKAFSAAAPHTATGRRCSSPLTSGRNYSNETLSGGSRWSKSRRSESWQMMAAVGPAGAAGSGGGAEETDVVIVGAGLAGLGAALALQKAGKQGNMASLMTSPDQDLLRSVVVKSHCLQSVPRSPLAASISDISYRQREGGRAKLESQCRLNACTLICNEANLTMSMGCLAPS